MIGSDKDNFDKESDLCKCIIMIKICYGGIVYSITYHLSFYVYLWLFI